MKTLREIICEKGLTIRNAALDAEINENSLCQIINGHRFPGRYLRSYLEHWAGQPIDWDSNEKAS